MGGPEPASPGGARVCIRAASKKGYTWIGVSPILCSVVHEPMDRRVPSLVPLEAYRCAPLGRATASARAVLWSPRTDLRLAAMWGTPGDVDAAFLISAMETEVRDGAAPYASYVDLRDLHEVEAEAFERFLGFMRQRRSRFASLVQRSAIVASDRMASAAALGYTRLLGDPFPSRVFERGEDALGWLGVGAEATTMVADLRALMEQVRDATALTRLRDLWGRDLRHAQIASAARELGMSCRLLQRQLAAAGTTFRDELRRARVERAKRLLRETDAKLHAVAAEVGFEKAASLIDAFKRETGRTPRAWRAVVGKALSGNE